MNPIEIASISIGSELDLTGFNRDFEALQRRFERDRSRLSLTPRVDHTELHKLNQHLDLKLRHFNQVQQAFNLNPLTVRTDTRQLDALEQRLKRLQMGVITVDVRSSGNTTASGGFNQREFATDVAKAIARELKPAIRDAGRSTIRGGITQGFGEYFGMQIASNLQRSLKRELGIDINNLSGSLFRGGAKAARTVADNEGVKQAAAAAERRFGERFKAAGYRVGDGIVSALNDEGTTITSKINAFTKEAFKNVTFDDAAQSLRKDFQAIAREFRQALAQPDLLQPLTRPFDEALRRRRMEALQERAIPLVQERAQQILSQKRVKDSANVVNEDTREFFIATGGYAQARGLSGARLARDLGKELPEDAQIIWVKNTDTDIPKTSGAAQKAQALLTSLAKPNLRGYSKDAVEIAAQALAAIERNPSVRVKLLGESGGGFPAEEAATILRMMGVQNVDYLGVGTPDFVGRLDTSRKRKIMSPDEYLGAETARLYARLGLADVSASGQKILGVQGHPFEHYRAAGIAELMNFLQGMPEALKPQEVKEVLGAAKRFQSQDIRSLDARQLEDLSRQAFTNLQIVRRQIEVATSDTVADLQEAASLFEAVFVKTAPEPREFTSTRSAIEKARSIYEELAATPGIVAGRTARQLVEELEQYRAELTDRFGRSVGTTGAKYRDVNQQILDLQKQLRDPALGLRKPPPIQIPVTPQPALAGELALRPESGLTPQSRATIEVAKQMAGGFVARAKDALIDVGKGAGAALGREAEKILVQRINALLLQVPGQAGTINANARQLSQLSDLSREDITLLSQLGTEDVIQVMGAIAKLSGKLGGMALPVLGGAANATVSAAQNALLSDRSNIQKRIAAARSTLERTRAALPVSQDESAREVVYLNAYLEEIATDIERSIALLPAADRMKPGTGGAELANLKSQVAQIEKRLAEVTAELRSLARRSRSFSRTPTGSEIIDAQLLDDSPTALAGRTNLPQLPAADMQVRRDAAAARVAIQNSLREQIKAYGESFTAQIRNIKALGENTPKGQELAQSVTQVYAEAIAAIDQLVAALGQNATRDIKKAAATAKGQVTRARNKAAGISQDSTAIGDNVGGTLNVALRSKIDDLKATAADLADGVIEVVEDKFEIRSPSRWAMRIGQMIQEGLAIGLKSGGAAQEATEEAVEGLQSGFDGLIEKAKNLGLIGIAALIGSQLIEPAMQAAVAVRDTAVEFESLERIVRFASDSSLAYAQNMELIDSTVDRLSGNLRTATRELAAFSASTKDTSLEGFATQQLFEASQAAQSAFGLNAEQSDRVATALQQIATKPIVSSEELYQQLGDVIPGIGGIAARAYNMSPTELRSRLAAGEITSEEFLPRLSQQLLAETAGTAEESAETAQGKINQLDTAITRLQRTVGSAALPVEKLRLDTMTALVNALNGAIEKAIQLTPYLAAAITGSLVSALAPFAKGLAISTINAVSLNGAIALLMKGLAALKALALTSINPVSAALIAAVAAYQSFQAANSTAADGMRELTDATDQQRKALDDLLQKERERSQEQERSIRASAQGTHPLLAGKGDLSGSVADDLLSGRGTDGRRSGVENNPIANALIDAFGLINLDAPVRGLLRRTEFGLQGGGQLLFGDRIVDYEQQQRRAFAEAAARIADNANAYTSSILSRVNVNTGEFTDDTAVAQLAIVEAQLRDVQSRRRSLLPGDTEAREAVAKEEERLLKLRDQFARQVGQDQRQLDSYIQTLEAGLTELEAQLIAGEITQEDYEKNVKVLEDALEGATAAQDLYTEALDNSIVSLQQLQIAFDFIANQLTDANAQIDRSFAGYRSMLSQMQRSGALTQGQGQFQTANLQQAELAARMQAQQQAINEQRSLLGEDFELQRLLSVRNIGSVFDISPAELTRLAQQTSEGGDRDRLTTAAQQYTQLQQLETQIAQTGAELSESQAQLAQTIQESGRAIDGFYRDLHRQLEDIASTTEQMRIETARTNYEAELRRAIVGTHSSFVNNLVDSLIEINNLISQQALNEINGARRISEINRRMQDFARSREELERSLVVGGQSAIPGLPGSGSSAASSGRTVQFQGIQVTSAVDASGEPGLDYVVSNGTRGAEFGSLTTGEVIQIVTDQNWENRMERGGGGSRNGRRGYGNRVVVRTIDPETGEQVDILYAHLDRVDATVGQQVGVGTVLGTQGRTGSTTGAHVSADFFEAGSRNASRASLAMRDRVARTLARDPAALNQMILAASQSAAGFSPATRYVPRGGLVGQAERVQSDPAGAAAMAAAAQRLGLPLDQFVALMSWESAGTLNPNVMGGDGNAYQGLIQFSPDNQQRYGIRSGMTITEQMAAIERYLIDRGFQPGQHDIRHAYSAILAGNASERYWNRRDSNGTTVRNAAPKFQQGAHYDRAIQFLSASGVGRDGSGAEAILQGFGLALSGSASTIGGSPQQLTGANFDQIDLSGADRLSATAAEAETAAVIAQTDAQNNLIAVQLQQRIAQLREEFYQNDYASEERQIQLRREEEDRELRLLGDSPEAEERRQQLQLEREREDELRELERGIREKGFLVEGLRSVLPIAQQTDQEVAALIEQAISSETTNLEEMEMIYSRIEGQFALLSERQQRQFALQRRSRELERAGASLEQNQQLAELEFTGTPEEYARLRAQQEDDRATLERDRRLLDIDQREFDGAISPEQAAAERDNVNKIAELEAVRRARRAELEITIAQIDRQSQLNALIAQQAELYFGNPNTARSLRAEAERTAAADQLARDLAGVDQAVVDRSLSEEEAEQRRELYRRNNQLRLEQIDRNTAAEARSFEFEQAQQRFQSGRAILEELNSGIGAFGIRDRDLERQLATAQASFDMAAQLEQIQQMQDSMQVTAETAATMRSNLMALNEVRLENIENQFNGLTEVLQPVQAELKGFATGLITTSEDVGDALLNMLDRITSAIAEMGVSFVFDSLFSGLMGGGGGMVTPKKQSGGGDVFGTALSIASMFAGGGFFSEGGMVPGVDRGKDTFPAMLRPGEGVLTPEAVRSLGGPDFIRAANAGQLSFFADGGVMVDKPISTAPYWRRSGSSEDVGGGRRSAVEVRYSVTEVAGVRYVSEDQFRAGMEEAAKRGAEGGYQMTLTNTRNSPSVRRSMGLR